MSSCNILHDQIFAYGQTASGKTHTLLGSADEPGLILQCVRSIYDAIRAAAYSRFLVRISYLEVYNEDLRDLFSSSDTAGGGGGSGGRLKIVEDPVLGPWVRNAVSSVVTSPEQILGLLKYGEKQRTYGATNMNLHSSRSHVLFRVLMKRRFATSPSSSAESNDDADWDSDPTAAVRTSTISFVDLAGSERLKRTGATGLVLTEANAINTSLMTLGTVISKLSAGERAHIPYRDSKLTHLLSASLGGNSVTSMIACISPATEDREESSNTLRYASRAGKIINDSSASEIENLNQFIVKHREETSKLEAQLQESLENMDTREEEFRIREEKLERRVETSRVDLRDLQDEVVRLQEVAASEREELIAELDIMHKKLEQERRAISAGAPGMVPQELFEERKQLEAQLRATVEKAVKDKCVLEGELEDEKNKWYQRVETLEAEVASASRSDMTAVHGALRDEIERQKAEIGRLTELQIDAAAGLSRTAAANRSEDGASISLTRMLVFAERQLTEAQTEIETLKGDLVRAQQGAVVQGQAMAEELNLLRKELRVFAASQVEHSNFDVPEGFVLFFHAHSLPRIFALASPGNAHLLLRPHPSAPVVMRNLPLGITVEVDPSAVAVALQANAALQSQIERLVPSSLSERSFWLHYFSHVHAIKAHVASQARAKAARMSKNGNTEPLLLRSFTAVMQEGILLRRHSKAGSIKINKVWLTETTRLSFLADGDSEPESFDLRELVRMEVGKTTAAFKVEPGSSSAIEELSFSLILRDTSISLEASARLERQALLEGFHMVIMNLSRA